MPAEHTGPWAMPRTRGLRPEAADTTCDEHSLSDTKGWCIPMKKMLCLLLALCLLPLFAVADTQAAAPALSEEDLAFVFEGVSYRLGDDPAALLAAVEAKYGEAMTKYEYESAYFDGTEKEYSNDMLDIITYPCGEDGADEIEMIMVLTDEITTVRGACVGMTLDEVAELYGDSNYTLDYDQMSCTLEDSGEMLLFSFDLESDEVLCWSLFRNTIKE